jgi:hypothetical protein
MPTNTLYLRRFSKTFRIMQVLSANQQAHVKINVIAQAQKQGVQ